MTASHIASVFLDHWVFPYGTPRFILSDNGPQFVGKFFTALFGYLGCRKLETTAYHPQNNGQTERYNKKIAARLRHYVTEHQDDWDTFVQPLIYAYNNQVHRSSKVKPFSLTLTRPPPDATMASLPTAFTGDSATDLTAGKDGTPSNSSFGIHGG